MTWTQSPSTGTKFFMAGFVLFVPLLLILPLGPPTVRLHLMVGCFIAVYAVLSILSWQRALKGTAGRRRSAMVQAVATAAVAATWVLLFL